MGTGLPKPNSGAELGDGAPVGVVTPASERLSTPGGTTAAPTRRRMRESAWHRYLAARTRMHTLLEESRPGDRWAKYCAGFLVVLILLNVLAVILESVDEIHAEAPPLFHWFEILSVSVFAIEYALRLWSCTASDAYQRPLHGRIRFATRPLSVIDLLAILPFFLPLVAGLDLRMLRAVRLMRLIRLFKVARYSASLGIIANVLHRKRHELVMTILSVFILLVVAASLIHTVERDAQPDKFGSIPAAMWWAVCTLTTVGYGDVYPITPAGKLLGAIIAVLGIGVFALPTGILGAGFIEELQRRNQKPRLCSHCGREIQD